MAHYPSLTRKSPLLRSTLRLLALAAPLVLTIACTTAPAAAQDEGDLPTVELAAVAQGLESPTTIVHAGDGSGRLFVLEQPGRIRVIDGGELLGEPFLDLTGAISSGGEQGLLGLAFHPEYPEENSFFVNYTDPDGTTVVARYRVSDDPNRADSESEERLLTVEQPYGNHNGGGLAFGPDGFLYISLGDGGAGGDPHDNGQNTSTLLGSLLRIDVSGEPYAVPDDNPFAGGGGDARPEIWAFGLRNPWRFSFDRETGDLWIADVGQNMWEEINYQPAGSNGGENYGWRLMEASHCFEPADGCEQEGLVLPVVEYDHDEGCSVTGGYVYRGSEIPELQGRYLFGDYCSGTIWVVPAGGDSQDEESGLRQHRVLLESGLRISAFGEDEAGEIYVADHGSGAIYRLVAAGE